MDVSLFLAKLLGLYYLIVAALWIIRKDQFEKVAKGIFSSPALLGLTGIISLILGLAIVIGHPIWHFNWQGLITLLGLFFILQGAARIVFSEEVGRYGEQTVLQQRWIYIAVLIILGLFLTYNGFANHLPLASS